MKLSPVQVKHINTRRKHVKEILDHRPERGFISYAAELIAIDTIIELHNLELAEAKKTQ